MAHSVGTYNDDADYDISAEGVMHINIWTRSKCELGRMLAHFYHSKFVHPFYGPFVSMEGFWQYIKSAERDDNLRTLSGHAAKEYGRNLTMGYVEGFCDIINAANFYKIEQNPRIQHLFLESTLPFDQYYLHGPGDTVVRTVGHDWIVKGFEDIRTMMMFGERPPALYENVRPFIV